MYLRGGSPLTHLVCVSLERLAVAVLDGQQATQLKRFASYPLLLLGIGGGQAEGRKRIEINQDELQGSEGGGGGGGGGRYFGGELLEKCGGF